MDVSQQKSEINRYLIPKIIRGPCTDVLRQLLTKQVITLRINKEFRSFLKKKHHAVIEDMCKHIEKKDFSYFNIQMLYASLRCICSISPHKNEWGNFPDEKDRSLAANIERIYSTYMEYIHYPNPHLTDSVFEQEWKSIFQTVKELEKHLGSGTKHQDTLHKLKTSGEMISMGKLAENEDIRWEHEIAAIEDIGKLVHLVLEEEEKYKDIKPVEKKYHKTESEKEAEGIKKLEKRTESEMEAEGIKILELGTTYHMEKFKTKLLPFESESEESDKFQDRTEHIASKELTELFSSFNVEFRDDPSDESFALGILQSHTLELVSAINSLSKEVVLTKNILPFQSPSNKAMVSEIDVVYKGGQFHVVKKDTFHKTYLTHRTEFSPPLVMLITSKFLPVVKAKLMVYEKYKHTINARKIYLQHEYEEFDNIAKLVAFNHLRSFCTYIESIINAFTVDFYQIFTTHVDRPLAAKDIKEMCLKAFSESRGLQPYNSYNTEDKRGTRYFERWVAFRIHKKLSGKGDLISTDTWLSIWNICKKTVEDLGVILSGLEEFLAKVLPPNQDRDIADWHKIEVIRNKSLLREYPSIIKYIAGHKGDGKEKVKVYLSDDDEKAEQFFKKECCEVLKNPDFEFVIVGKTNEILDQNEEMELLEEEEEDSSTDNIDWTQLIHIIKKCENKIYARYSNVIGIEVGNVTGVANPTQEDIGVILCCLDKTLIPFGETPLPEYIEGWPCGFKEDFFMFGACPQNCTSTDPNLPKPGCSIGIPSDSFCGSTGFLYKSNCNEDESGFLTASHVAIKNCKDLYLENKPLSDHLLGRQKHVIVHPSFLENNAINNPVGKVIESFFGNYGDPPIGLDCAVVRCKFPSIKEMEVLTAVTKNELNFKNTIKVKKTGRTTETTYGYLIKFNKHRRVSANLSLTATSDAPYRLETPYVVRNMYKNKPFFKKGDSGSAVFVLGEKDQPDKALGIAFGFSNDGKHSFVCNIEQILTKLDLKLVRCPPDAWVWSMED